MGIMPGSLVELEQTAPFGDPIALKVRGCRLSLRRKEAGEIEIE
jgi:Fe2+ transport system protein FeoA